MAKNEFKHYALHYLNLWVSRDRSFCEALAGSDNAEKLKFLAKAAVFYRIARNLPTKYDVDKGLPRFGPVLEIIGALNPVDFEGENLVPSINRVRKKISSQYGRRDVLSATTKFLWLKMQSPIIIYDSQARRALGAASGKIDEYYSLWRRKFNAYETQIRDACDSLQEVHEYTEEPETSTPQYIVNIAAKQWFRERMFDAYLWNTGLGDQSTD